MKYPVALTVNGRECLGEVEARTLLVHFLREDLGLTGTRVGCETSVCGACTVLVNGLAVKSCARLAVQADGAAIVTIEGLAAEARREKSALESGLHPLQESFLERHAVQCGFCTAGMLLVAKDFLERNADPCEEEIRSALDGNLCACTGHERIVEAVRQAAAGLRERNRPPPPHGKKS
ncbi:MAG TPA: (2Fe-2S)-binding protein [Planctomycetota bacterium]|nr:(2Fe-2S)-binding protein [Planctomycetota bacterium]